jgi:hypothetical protein
MAGLLPEEGADQRSVYLWKIRIGITLMLVLAMTSLYTVIIFGLAPTMFAPVLRADELQTATGKLQAQIARVQQDVAAAQRQTVQWRLSQIESALLDARAKHCKAKTEEGRRLVWNSISNMMMDYQAITGNPYQLPSCGDL